MARIEQLPHDPTVTVGVAARPEVARVKRDRLAAAPLRADGKGATAHNSPHPARNNRVRGSVA